MRYPWVEARRRSPSLRRVQADGVVVWVVCGCLILAGLVAWRMWRPDLPFIAADRADVLVASPSTRHPGLLIDRRDDALGRVLAAPADLEAMDSLIRSQRHLSANNSVALRARAAAYARAASAGEQTSEHYTPRAMRMLVLANLLGATQIETQAGVLPPPGRLLPTAASAPLPPRRVSSVMPVALPPVRIARRAHALVAPPTTAAVGPQSAYFLVVSAPLLVQQAQHEVNRLAAAGFAPLLRQASDGRVQAQVGAFATRANAEKLAARARGRGLNVRVIHGPAAPPFRLRSPAAPVTSDPKLVATLPSFSQLMERGVRLYAGGWYGPAMASFRQAAGTRSRSAQAHLWWGRAAFKLSRFRESRDVLSRTLELSNDPEVVRQARLLLEMMPTGRGITSTSGVE